MANEWKSKISAIFAEQGDTVDIPVETQADNQVSFATGYTKNYNKDAKDDLGNPLVKFGIERTKFNYLFKIITSAIKELQETIPVYTTDTDEQKVDVGAIVENTVAFNALTNLLCIDNTGKASKITKEELIAQLNPNIDLSNSNISVTAIADTALNNFLAIDGTTVKKANKLLQEVIEEIDLSADNVKVTKETTYTDNHKILVVNSAGATHKVDKLLQSAIDEINLSADNINVKHINTGTTTLKPLMVDENGKITSEDNISSNLVKGDILAKGFKTIVMTKEQYPNGIDDLTETGLYSLASMDEYKDIVNDSLPSERKEYIKKVLGQILTLLDYSNEQTTNLDITKFSDLIYCPTHQIQVVGVSQGDTDNTIIQQSFILFGMTLGTRTGTMTLNNTEFNDIIKMNGLPYVPINAKTADNIKTIFITEESNITSVKDLPYGYNILIKELSDEPVGLRKNHGVPFIHKYNRIANSSSVDMYIAYVSLSGLIEIMNMFAYSQIGVDNPEIVWSYDLQILDLSTNIIVSKSSTKTASNTFLMINTDDKIVTVEKDEIINGIVEDVNAGIELTNYFNKNTDKLNLSNQVENVLDIAHGGTGGTTKEQAQNSLGINAFKRYNYERLDLNKAKNGVLVARTDYLENRPSSLINGGEIIVETVLGENSTTFSDNDEYTYNIQSYKSRSSFEYAKRVCKPNGVVGEWEKLRNVDGSIPEKMGGTGLTRGALCKPTTIRKLSPSQPNGTNYKAGDIIHRYSFGDNAVNLFIPNGGTWIVESFVFEKNTNKWMLEYGTIGFAAGGTQLDTNPSFNFFHILTKIS